MNKKTVKAAIIAFNVAIVIITVILTVASFFNGIDAFNNGQTAAVMLYAFAFVGGVSILSGRYMKVYQAFKKTP